MCAALNNLEKEPTNATINNKSNSSSQSVLCTACCFGLSKNQPKPNTNYSISQNNPFLEDNNENDVYEIQDVSNNSKPKTSTSLSFPNSKSVAYSPESPSTTSCPTMSPKNTMPTQMGFLVSFLVDARGGAMQGNRGSGMRLIIPPGAVDHPTRVTCRYLRGSGDRLPFPPPLMERESLSSRVIEVGPSPAEFHCPVLLEVPHFASVRGGERELIVLRCDDGETWREHTTTYLQTSWQGGDEEIYADFVATTGITAAYQALDTSRIVRISCTTFPKYFAILSRVKEEVRAIGADGGKVVSSHEPHVQAFFPPGALQKKIKVALQAQKVPPQIANLTCGPNSPLKFSPLVGIEPRRRRFHHPVQIALPLSAAASSGSKDPKSKIRLLCSLVPSSNPVAVFEDVTEMTEISVSKKSVIFESKVSALFWAVYLEEVCAETCALLVPSAQKLYEELMLTPYMARFVVLYKPHTPHAWCDTLRIICVTDDKAETWGELSNLSWMNIATSDEMEVASGSVLSCQIEGGIEIANDCQLEFGHKKTLTFHPFMSNSCTLLVRPRKGHPKVNQGHLIVKKSQIPITTLDLDLRDPDDQIGSLPDLSEDDDQDVVIDNDEETIYEPLKQTHVINVKEYEHDQNVDEDVVFVPI